MPAATTALTNWGCINLTHQIEYRAWPDFRHGGFYLDMIEFADEAIVRETRADQLAAILIYQQLVEEWLHAVDYWCFFEGALGMFPTEFGYTTPDRITFGQLIERVARHQAFKNKDNFLNSCRRLNSEVRNKVVHKLFLDSNLKNLPEMARIAQKCCNEITELIPAIQECFWDRYNRLAEQTKIQDKRNG